MYESERRSRDYYEGRARWYDWANRLAALVRGESATNERRKAVRRLNLKPGDRVLEVSVGTGTNLPLIAEEVGPNGRIVGLDISSAMLSRCRRKLRDRGLQADLVEGEAAHLPFRDGALDAVLHHGGIAEFGDKRGAIEEMVRVARPGAKVVICDVGVPTDRKPSLVNRLLLKLQPAYAQPPPLDLIPSSALDMRVSWFHGGAWYMIEFVIP
ncbi:MAG: class I SAM-dependent methyltransferase [Dehalococcoidia bacterium]|nr:class I SAM-dependent methyltransferase [Dehalococcoidia bacterium]